MEQSTQVRKILFQSNRNYNHLIIMFKIQQLKRLHNLNRKGKKDF